MAMDAVRHANRIALVTGAGSGIGRATVLRLVQEGAAVIGCDINSDGLDGTRRALDELGMSAELDIADVTQQGDVDRLVAATGPRIDILANVAGIMDHFLPLGDVDDATWNRVLDVNLTGVMRLSRAVLPVMERNGGGAIVTVASKASVGGGVAGVAYASSKHAVIGLVQSIAYYYAPRGIRSNAVLPGGVETGIGASAAPAVPWAMERSQLAMPRCRP